MKIKAQSDIIKQQKRKTENLKAASVQLGPKSLTEAMTQAMVCMYNTNKDPTEKNIGTKPPRDKPYLGKRIPSQVTKGPNGSTTNLDLGKEIPAETLQVRFQLVKRAVAVSSKGNLECMERKMASLDSRSMVSLVQQSYLIQILNQSWD